MLALSLVSFACTVQILLHTRGLSYLLLLIWQIFNLYFAVLMVIFIFRVKEPREHILGFDNLAHNLNNCYLPFYDLFRIILDPVIKRKDHYEESMVVDYSVLEEFATKKIRHHWFIRSLRRGFAEYTLLAAVLVIFAAAVRGKNPVLIEEPAFNNLSTLRRDMTISNWKNQEVQFLSDFSDRLATFEEDDMQLWLRSNLDGSVTGSEMQMWDFYGYGRYSVIMKPAAGTGVNSSFFTYTGPKDNNPWDEIDIEFPGKDTTTVQFNYYHNGVGNHEYLYNLGFDACEDFHEYGYEWTPDSITWYVDDKAVHSVSTGVHAGNNFEQFLRDNKRL